MKPFYVCECCNNKFDISVPENHQTLGFSKREEGTDWYIWIPCEGRLFPGFLADDLLKEIEERMIHVNTFRINPFAEKYCDLLMKELQSLADAIKGEK